MEFASAPICLRRCLSLSDVLGSAPVDAVYHLGSFWPNYAHDFESHIVKAFKESHPTDTYQPHITALCRFYADLICDLLKEQRFDCIARVLSSSEEQSDPKRAQSLLVNILSDKLGTKDITPLFYKTSKRPSLRSVKRLSGPDAFRDRIPYILQDLFLRAERVGGSLLLIDDIYNTGASAAVYACAARKFLGCNRVVNVNLAATRFYRGKDGLGMLSLDTRGLAGCEGMEQMWLDKAKIIHKQIDCLEAKPPLTCGLRYMISLKGDLCPACFETSEPPRRWWQIWKST